MRVGLNDDNSSDSEEEKRGPFMTKIMHSKSERKSSHSRKKRRRVGNKEIKLDLKC